MKRIDHDTLTASSTTKFTVHWYFVCGLVAVCLGIMAGLSVCMYRCYQRRRRSRGSFSGGRPDRDLIGADGDSHGSNSSSSGKGYLKKDRNSMHGFGGDFESSGSIGKSQPIGGRQQSRSAPAEKPSSLQYGPPGAITCQGKIIQTQCYTANEKERLVRSPELNQSNDEKQESMRETTTEDGDTDGAEVHLGLIEFMVGYDKERSSLAVTVVRAKNLPIKNSSIGSSDPYIKLQLLPDKRQKVKTRVLRKTLNPQFDETFTFYGVDENQLSDITLHFVVLSFDRFSRDDVIGEVIYQLDELDPESSKKSMLIVRQSILPRKMVTHGRGELLLSICHHPVANRLTVVILKARGLPKMDITGLTDPYVKIYLTYNGQRLAKKKTHTKKRTLNPVFNESFVFDLPTSPTTSCPAAADMTPAATVGSAALLAGVSLEMVVLDWDQMTKNDLIGRVEIGANCTGETELRHWVDVVNSPRKQIASWHKLKE